MNESYFTKRFIVSRKTFNNDWNVEAWENVSYIRGFYQPRTGGASYANGTIYDNVDAIIFCRVGEDVQTYDRITTASGRQFEVVFSQEGGVSGLGDHQELGLKDVEG